MDQITADYFKKYIKYKNKYFEQKAGFRKTTEQQYDEQLNNLLEQLDKKNISVQLVNEIIDFFKKFVTKNYDPEKMHILEDKLMSQFIANLAEKKTTNLSEIQAIAIQIKTLNDENYLKWYS
jgi:signal recognition particle GTPase